jgi:hypothetical protein
MRWEEILHITHKALEKGDMEHDCLLALIIELEKVSNQLAYEEWLELPEHWKGGTKAGFDTFLLTKINEMTKDLAVMDLVILIKNILNEVHWRYDDLLLKKDK